MHSLYEQNFLQKMTDGTVKQLNPFTGTQVWTVPGRGNRFHTKKDDAPVAAAPFETKEKEDFCHFCPANYLKTPPEKARLVKDADGTYKTLTGVKASELFDTVAEFRRIPNLFEIISFDYWEKNYGYVMNEECAARKEAYLEEAGGREHILEVISAKLKMSGLTKEEIDSISLGRKLQMANSFFAGGHELIIGKRHYVAGAGDKKASSGNFTPDEHYQFINFTIAALKNIYLTNRYVRYVTVFQNWLNQAGASFDHLHKQLVAIDGISASNAAEFRMARDNPNMYNDYAVNYAGYQNLIFAENDYAVAFADFGHRYPTLAIFSKAERNQPWNLTPEQVRGMSDIVHACHAAMGDTIPCNEEWYYRPPAVDVAMPWHILIKWRISNPAGFEAVTKIFVNTIDPWHLRDRVVPVLFDLRKAGKIAPDLKIASECDCTPNCLRYNPALQPPTMTPYAMRGRGSTMDW